MTADALLQPVPGTIIFNGREAMKGYALNKMCYSFNERANRDAFVLDEEAYMERYGLTGEQRRAVRDRNVLALIAAGGNIYYLAKLAGIFGLGVQDIGAQQTGMLQLLWPGGTSAIRTVPISFNTVQHPIPSPARCYRFGQSLGAAIEAYPDDLRVVVIGTGGLSHQLDGTRAGFINKPFDLMCLEKIVDEPEALTAYSSIDLVRLAGAQGAEFIMWLAMRGALTGTVRRVHTSYHIPISNTAAGVLLLENAA